MKVEFNFTADANIVISIEGTSVGNCREKLMGMALADMIDEGYVKHSAIKELDAEVKEEDLTVDVTDIAYEIDDEYTEEEKEIIKLMPTEEPGVRLYGVSPEDSIERLIRWEIEHDYPIESFQYKIVARS